MWLNGEWFSLADRRTSPITQLVVTGRELENEIGHLRRRRGPKIELGGLLCVRRGLRRDRVQYGIERVDNDVADAERGEDCRRRSVAEQRCELGAAQ